jgi:hypothetical protein
VSCHERKRNAVANKYSLRRKYWSDKALGMVYGAFDWYHLTQSEPEHCTIPDRPTPGPCASGLPFHGRTAGIGQRPNARTIRSENFKMVEDTLNSVRVDNTRADRKVRFPYLLKINSNIYFQNQIHNMKA